MCVVCGGEGEEEEEEEEEGGGGVMKPDIVFFGEGLPDEFHRKLEEDKAKVRNTVSYFGYYLQKACMLLSWHTAEFC